MWLNFFLTCSFVFFARANAAIAMDTEPTRISQEFHISFHFLFAKQMTRTAKLPMAKNTPQILNNIGDNNGRCLRLGVIRRKASTENPTAITSKTEKIIIVLALTESCTPYSRGFRQVTR